jgi:hypothetical protein
LLVINAKRDHIQIQQEKQNVIFVKKERIKKKSGQTSCDKCPTGTYMPSKGSDEKNDCIKCPKGNKCPGKGLTEPTDCDKGT